MEKINGFVFEGENEYGKYTMTVEIKNGRVTVDSESHIGTNCIFNEAEESFENIAQFLDALHDQGLEDLENAIADMLGIE